LRGCVALWDTDVDEEAIGTDTDQGTVSGEGREQIVLK
jgi:hypothetical protein